MKNRMGACVKDYALKRLLVLCLNIFLKMLWVITLI